ncbi:MAG: hypothetical protein CL920_39215 [Deltaproteobacteria bacterium]|nr:hypothetical protein [Deltaproteobacteria bacterium]MBU54766.1 hypothetical protein [Deltaproteobacteria bacterium]|tara:strand:- start:16628 stop:20260 length:3633 start_codon:yes stop_codon:yes gene_type:complete
MIPLGPFALESVIGQGGMAEVWSAVHREQGERVAVKVMTGERAQEPLFQSSFRNEVRSIAGLDHPNIAMVFDCGRIEPVTEALSQGKLQAGSPYLIMEWAEGGALRALCGRLPWNKIRGILLLLLDALSHAHARKVIHRDIKPENVLLRQGRSALVLTDFGLAHALDSVTQVWESNKAVGTPSYMAPEQFIGHWRDYGPWTDLYALGCLGYTLATGRPPFGRSSSFKDMKKQHMSQPVPPLRPKTKVPLAFERWLGKLLEKDPTRRFRMAADAAWALREIPNPDAGPFIDSDGRSTSSMMAISSLSSMQRSFLFGENASIPQELLSQKDYPQIQKKKPAIFSNDLETIEVESIASLHAKFPTSPPKPQQPEIPSSWHRPSVQGSPLRLLGVGLGLYGLRSVPLVDREDERNRLWDALRRVRREKKVQAVVLHGPSGCGKSRLAQWLCERAHEVGAAQSLQVLHSPMGGAGDGLASAITRYFRCRGMSRRDILVRLEKILRKQGIHAASEWNALTELIEPATDEDLKRGAQLIRFHSVTERYVLVQRLLQRMCRERPVILWLDDIHWGLEALGFVTHLLDAGADGLPVLIVMTAQREALAQRLVERGYLQEIRSRHDAQQLEVGALPIKYRSILIRELLGLEGELAALVEERTAGNPLFAVRLVEDWVQRGLLEIGARGFRLKEGAEVDFPDSLYQVWGGQIDYILQHHGEDEAIALELAAVLGQTVDYTEWLEACAELGVSPARGLIDELISYDLATRPKRHGDKTWSFVHSMLRESLERRAREARRWQDLHLACERMLRKHKGMDFSRRRGLHLLAAGKFEGALMPLEIGIHQKIDAGDFRAAEMLLDEREEALYLLDVDDTDVQWGRQWLLRCKLERIRGEFVEASDWARRTIEVAQRFAYQVLEWQYVHGRALRELGEHMRMLAEFDTALDALLQAEEIAIALHDARLLVSSRRQLGLTWLERGQLDKSRAAFLQALFDSQELDDRMASSHCRFGLGSLARQAGYLEQAIGYLKEAMQGFALCGARSHVANCLNTLGEIERFQGFFPQAEQFYRDALRLYREIGTTTAIVPELNLGLLLLEQGRFHESRVALEACLTSLQRIGRRGLVALVHICLLPDCAIREDWSAWDVHLQHAIQILEDVSFVDIDLARMFHLAGDMAMEADDTERAMIAYRLAYKHWMILERPEEAQMISETLRNLSYGADDLI